MKIRIGIMGYGNLGKGIECAVRQNDDMELVAIFTRREPETVKVLSGVPVYHVDKLLDMKDAIDVLMLCGGSATDLPKQTVEYAGYFNVVDSFDTHAMIPTHFANVDAQAKKSGKIAMISVGWDPGMFSLNRLYANAILRDGKDYTFWGKGVSQGHSDAIRRIPGVKKMPFVELKACWMQSSIPYPLSRPWKQSEIARILSLLPDRSISESALW